MPCAEQKSKLKKCCLIVMSVTVEMPIGVSEKEKCARSIRPSNTDNLIGIFLQLAVQLK